MNEKKEQPVCNRCGDCCRQFAIRMPVLKSGRPLGMLLFWNLHENIFAKVNMDKKGRRWVMLQVREKCNALIEHPDGTTSCKLYWMRPPICREWPMKPVGRKHKDMPTCPLLGPWLTEEELKQMEADILPRGSRAQPKLMANPDTKTMAEKEGRVCNRCGDCCRQFVIVQPVRGKRVPAGMLHFWNLHENVYATAHEDEKGKKFIQILLTARCSMLIEHPDGTCSCKIYWMRPAVCWTFPTDANSRQHAELPNCSLLLPRLTDEEIEKLMKETRPKRKRRSREKAKTT